MKKRYLYTSLVIFISLALPLVTLAQAGPDDPNDVPIDGGLTLLLAAGAAYGAKKYRDGRAVKEAGPEPK
jgi:hypothetical protein